MKSFFGHKNKKANFKLQPKKQRTAKDNLKQDKKIIKKRIFKNTWKQQQQKRQDFFSFAKWWWLRNIINLSIWRMNNENCHLKRLYEHYLFAFVFLETKRLLIIIDPHCFFGLVCNEFSSLLFAQSKKCHTSNGIMNMVNFESKDSRW